MNSVPYIFLRGLELEGRHPHDVGGWPVTVRRMEVGEGVPLPDDPARWIEVAADAPYPPSPRIPPSRRGHSFCYRRLRSVAECERYLALVEREVPVSLRLFAGWANPVGGVIPMPAAGEQPLDSTHLVVLDAYSPVHRLFHFQNTWGEEWGDRGHGYLPADYFERYGFECWVTYGPRISIESTKFKVSGDRGDRRWVVRDEWQRRVYGYEIWDTAGKDRRAWAFVMEKDGALEIEDLYVRPEFRRKGYGRVLAGKVAELAKIKGQALRLWVPFADCRQENPSNHPALIAIARLLGLQFQPCPVIWAAYFATNERPGEALPVEPVRIPARPKSTLGAVLAMAVALGTNPAGQASPAVAQPAAAESRADFPAVGTEAWGIMNCRRAELIRRKVRGGLSDGEEQELEQLQRETLAAVDRAFPRPPVDLRSVAELEERLKVGREQETP
jgi:GNAT superfamily N-acetyltransferase